MPYTDAQYQALTELTQALMVRYPHITLPRITGHQYIAPLRKTDPVWCLTGGVFGLG